MKQNEKEIVESTKQFVYEQMNSETSGHDYEHSLRVYRMVNYLAEGLPVNSFVMSIAALVHDLIDTKIIADENEAIQTVNYFLEGEGVIQRDIESILEIITTISYRKNSALDSLEAEIVQDADRLDAMGAIGIARAFTFGGNNDQLIYSAESDDTTVQHFYDKLLKLYELLNTEKAKEIGMKRHQLMQDYLIELLADIQGDY